MASTLVNLPKKLLRDSFLVSPKLLWKQQLSHQKLKEVVWLLSEIEVVEWKCQTVETSCLMCVSFGGYLVQKVHVDGRWDI